VGYGKKLIINIDYLILSCFFVTAKNDNKNLYKEFWKNKQVSNIILSKYPNDNFSLGQTQIVNKNLQYTPINLKKCLIKGDAHENSPNSMYVEIVQNLLCIKCKDSECFGKLYPLEHIQLNRQEMKVMFNGNVTININNNVVDNDYVDFQQIDIYENEEVNYLVYEGLNNKAASLAEIIYYYNKDWFMFAEDENWYTFNGNLWVCTEKSCVDLMFLMKSTIKGVYDKLIHYYKENGNDSLKIQKIKQIIASTSDTNCKRNILAELSWIYSKRHNPERNFTDKLDSNQYLLGFRNGIYDLEKHIFRQGRPGDYVSMSTGYDYCGEHSENYPDLLKFFHDILPNEAEYEYFLLYLSHALYGNVLELFTILTGVGRNGKSKTIELLKLTFGQYFGSTSNTFITRLRPDANQPDPGLLSLAKKKILITSEPEKNCKLNTGFLKFITGRDTTTLRKCHSNNMIEFSPKFLTFLICNDIPDCDDIDNAFSRRLRCINFPIEFVDDPKTNMQKLMDTTINEKFINWRNDFMLLLISYYKKYSETKKLVPTPNILAWTNKYKEGTDLYLTYLNEQTEVYNKNIAFTELYEDFKMWFGVNNPGTLKPAYKEFKIGIEKHKAVSRVRIGEKIAMGIKKLKLIDRIYDDDE
jgi:P4 family phage/plasmid primase-like protien